MIAACGDSPTANSTPTHSHSPTTHPHHSAHLYNPPPPPRPPPRPLPPPRPSLQLDRAFVPVLCYHHIRDWEATDTEDDRAYIVPPAKLEEELKWLKDNGYTSVSAQQVYDYEINGLPLPPKPVMLSFDDNDDNQ